jgi:hypothetical protein
MDPPGGLNDPTYRPLQSLPTDPHALLSLICAQTKGAGPGPDAEAFTTIGDLPRESVAPPKVSAALYSAAALIPGVRVLADVPDAVGSHGVAVAVASQKWIFSTTTMQMIGGRDIDPATGAVTGTTAVLRRAIVDRLGEVPAGT